MLLAAGADASATDSRDRSCRSYRRRGARRRKRLGGSKQQEADSGAEQELPGEGQSNDGIGSCADDQERSAEQELVGDGACANEHEGAVAMEIQEPAEDEGTVRGEDESAAGEEQIAAEKDDGAGEEEGASEIAAEESRRSIEVEQQPKFGLECVPCKPYSTQNVRGASRSLRAAPRRAMLVQCPCLLTSCSWSEGSSAKGHLCIRRHRGAHTIARRG